MPESASPASESSKAVTVGEPPTPEGWPKTIWICEKCGEQPGAVNLPCACVDWGKQIKVQAFRVAPVGGAGQEHRVREATRILHLSTDKPWELIYAARRVLVGEQGGVGGTGEEDRVAELFEWAAELGTALDELHAVAGTDALGSEMSIAAGVLGRWRKWFGETEWAQQLDAKARAASVGGGS